MAYTKRFEDFFTEAADTNLESHTPDTGASWTRNTGTAAAIVEESTDTLTAPYFAGSTTRYYTANISGTWADKQKAEAKNAQLGLSVYRVMVRLSASDDGYSFGWDTGGSQWRLHRIDNATSTELATGSGAPSAGDKWQIDASGSTITGYLNDVSKASASDATYSSGKPGLRVHKTETATGIDDFAGYDEATATSNPWYAYAQQ